MRIVRIRRSFAFACAIGVGVLGVLGVGCGGGEEDRLATTTTSPPRNSAPPRARREQSPPRRPGAGSRGRARRRVAPSAAGRARTAPPPEVRRRIAKARARFRAAQTKRAEKMAALPRKRLERLIRDSARVALRQLRLEGARVELGSGESVTVRVAASRACRARPDSEKQFRRLLRLLVPVVRAVTVRVEGGESLSAYTAARCPEHGRSSREDR